MYSAITLLGRSFASTCGMPDGKPDGALIEDALAEIPKLLAPFDAAYRGRDYPVVNTPSMADLFLSLRSSMRSTQRSVSFAAG